jgi:voltage-gated potassium channel
VEVDVVAQADQEAMPMDELKGRTNATAKQKPEKELARESWVRWRTLKGLEAWLDTPMVILSFIWLLLVVAELVRGASPLFEVLGTAIWGIFFLEFALRLSLAPRKLVFVRRNWLTAFSLLVPALRVFRVLRVLRLARAARGVRLVKIVGTANRAMNALRRSMARRGFGYVSFLTVLIDLLGAGGMLALEGGAGNQHIHDYGDAIWWSSMILVTMGTDYWPLSAEGRILCFLLALYGFAVFGYITAVVASFFLGQEAQAARKQEKARPATRVA